MKIKPASKNPDDVEMNVSHVDNFCFNESIIVLLKKINRQLDNKLDRELAPYNLTHQQFKIIFLLKQNPRMTSADLARHLHLDSSALVRMVDRLEEKNFVRRIRSVKDRRSIHIELTSDGKLFADTLPIISINLLNRYLSSFSRHEALLLEKYLRQLISSNESEI